MYLREAIKEKIVNASSIFLGQDKKDDNIDDGLPTSKDPNVTNKFASKIKAITNFKGLTNVSNKKAQETNTILKINSSPYIVVGPFKVDYSGTSINGVKINGKKTSTAYWTDKADLSKEKNWSKTLSKIPINEEFYLALKKSELPSTEKETYKITFCQNEVTYCRARMVLLEIKSGQQLAFVANGGEHQNGEVDLSYNITHKDKASLTIEKEDRLTGKKIKSVKLKVYGESSDGSGNGWVGSNGSLVSYDESSTFGTNSEGKVTISKLAPGKYYIYEIGTGSGYSLENQRSYFADSKDPKGYAGQKKYDNIVYLSNQTLARTTIKTRTFYQYEMPKLTVKKVDYNNPNKKLNGVKFGIYLNEKGWAVYNSATKSITYDKNHKTLFETGKGYCGIAAKDGEFTLTNLLTGNYKVIELETTSEYLLSEQAGYDSSKKYVRCGRDSYLAGYTTVYKSDGKTKYDFMRSKYGDKTKENLYVDYIHLDWYESYKKYDNGDINYGTNYATFIVKNKLNNNNTELKIKKLDKSNGDKIQGAKFKALVKLTQDQKVENVTFKKDTYAWIQSQQGGLTIDASKALEVTSNEEGIASLVKIPYGHYYIYETAAAQGYSLSSQSGYKSGKPADYTKTFLSNEWGYVGEKDINTNSLTVTLDVKNIKTGLKIIKKDGNKNKTLYLGGARIKIYGTNLDNNTSGWLKKTGMKYEYTDYANSSTFTTDSKKGEINIEGIKKGEYYVYEIGAPDEYILNRQDGYKVTEKGSSEIKASDWVYLGKTSVDSKKNQVEINVENNKYIDIKGKVWGDNPDSDKLNTAKYNNTYDNKDTLLSGVTVKLVENGTTGKVLATTKTNKSGEYTISKTSDNKKITYDDVKNYHIEFEYNNKQYIVAQAFAGNDAVSSKAKIYEIKNSDLNDNNLTGTGIAVTYIGSDNNSILTKYYNKTTGSIENINLGLIEKMNPSHSIDQEIAYVKIVKGDYTFKYKYGDNAIIDGSDKTQSAVRFGTPSKSFTQPVYPTDIAYNIANGLNNNDPNAYKVYIVYRVLIKNTCTHNMEYIYKENALYLDSLSMSYDKKYELSNVQWADDKNSSDFGLWQQQSDKVVLNMNMATNKAFNSKNSGIKQGENEEVYVQFKVKDDALLDLVKPENNGETNIATTVIDDGWHKYERKDINWRNNNTYTHKSLHEIKTNSGLSIKLKLADSRKVSGVVFEDNKDNSRPNERIGDGKYTNGENKLSDVSVTLMEAIDNGRGGITYQTASLYNGRIYYDSATRKWKADKKEAHIIVTDAQSGKYTLDGIVPGKYYLKFTYGDGTTEYKKLDGSSASETIATKSNGQKIESGRYKSTIITGAAKDSSNLYWYLNQDKSANYSVAIDANETITNRMNSNSEIKNSTSKENEIINATSPQMDIKFEFSTRDEIDYNNKGKLYGECSGMSFGIIERPRVDIQLEKKVQSVKFTLANGTTLINGDENESPYLARIGDTYVKLEMKESYIYGSQAEVRYELKVKNNSEIDYATQNYYKYGTIDSGVTPVTTTVTKIVDYLDNKQCNYVNIDEKLQQSSNDGDYTGGKASYFTQEALNYNKNYKSILLKPQEKKLIPLAADTTQGKANSTETYIVSTNQLLSDQYEKTGWESTSEIIGIKNVTNTTQYKCIMGNYKVGDALSRVNGGTNETDNGNGVISISVPTGSDKSYTKYIFGGTMIIILGIGVVCIKKFVL